MFNTQFVEFLKTLNKVTNGIVLEYPVTSGKTDCSDIGFKFDISVFDDSGFEGKIGFVDLSSFLNIFNLFDEPEVQFKDGVISAKDGNASVKYITSAIDLISQFTFPVEQFSKTNDIPSVVEFNLSATDIKKLKASASTFKDANAVVFKGSENLEIALTQVGKFNPSANCFKITKDITSNKNFEVSVSLETFSKIPVIDYTVKVKYNESKDAYRLLFVSNDIIGFEMCVSTNV